MKNTKIVTIIAIIAIVLSLVVAGTIAMVIRNKVKPTPTRQVEQTTSESTQPITQSGTEQTTMQEPDANTIRVACVGDSITYGYGIANREEDSYPAQLGELLGEKYAVRNFGASGRTAMLSADKPYMYEEIYRESKEFKPDIVIVMLGTNDTKKINWDKNGFYEDFQLLLESYESLSTFPKIYVLTPPPLYLDNTRPTYPNKDTLKNEAVPLIRLIASKENMTLIDIYTPFENKPYLLADGCHPNEIGAQAIAKLVYAQMEKVS